MPLPTSRETADRPSFDELNALRLYLEEMLAAAVPTLQVYCDSASGGFVHILKDDQAPGHFSMASTATCVAFLVDTGQWKARDAPWAGREGDLIAEIVDSDWDSADIGSDNPFTVGFLLEALVDLEKVAQSPLTSAQRTVVRQKTKLLVAALGTGEGVSVSNFPPTAFITYKAARCLKRRQLLRASLAEKTAKWAWQRLFEESVLLAAKGSDSDVFELAYAVLTVSVCSKMRDMQPRQRAALGYAVDQLFEHHTDGQSVWPRSRPLFLYPAHGNAYCYDYELLTHLLSDLQLRPFLQRRIKELAASAYALDQAKIPLGKGSEHYSPSKPEPIGWSSGHLKQQLTRPESWTTASVFHYCHNLQRVVVELIRREIFAYASALYSPPESDHAPALDGHFLDSQIDVGNDQEPLSLIAVLKSRFLEPLGEHREGIHNGQAIPDGVPTSAILYGPPGTSKTELAQIIANYLGWPLLKLDPSYLTRHGLENLHAETNRFFSMLEAAEEMVVLFDEFDELVREREEQDSESASRFLTTAMLPKLTALSSRRRLVYLLATNHVERFDSAIRRPGRFDMIVPVMPPTLEEKLKKWGDVKTKFVALRIREVATTERAARAHLADLTFLEFKGLVPRILACTAREECLRLITEASRTATLNQGLGEHETWRQRIESQITKIRLPERPTDLV